MCSSLETEFRAKQKICFCQQDGRAALLASCGLQSVEAEHTHYSQLRMIEYLHARKHTDLVCSAGCSQLMLGLKTWRASAS